jgi:hypothetical protein
MRDRINKPKVFLSHSSLDKGFVEKLAIDLRKCQIEPWLDTEEIRDGRPWLKVIFEDGIPACDAIIVYLTDNSLNSKMVEREMDATFVEQLSESGVVILPYVSRAELRGRLRSDVRTLQCREWNEDNYDSILPTVVAEIWRSYTERLVGTAVLQEKTKRLESELEVQRIKDRYESTVFTASEEKEFSHIRQKLDRDTELTLRLYQTNEDWKEVGKEVYRVNLLSSLIYYINKGSHTFTESSIETTLSIKLDEDYAATNWAEGVNARPYSGVKEILALELPTYGLAKFKERKPYDLKNYYFEFTDKMYRFKYWLDYNGITPSLSFERIKVEIISQEEVTDEDRDLSYVVEIDEELSFQDRRARWRTTEEGMLAARQEVAKLYDELERLVNRSNEKLSNLKVDFIRRDENHCIISGRGRSLSLRWECKNTDSVENSELSVKGYEGESEADANSELTDQHKYYYQTEYTIDLQRDSLITWRGKSENQASTSEELAARFLSYFLNSIRNSAIYKN